MLLWENQPKLINTPKSNPIRVCLNTLKKGHSLSALTGMEAPPQHARSLHEDEQIKVSHRSSDTMSADRCSPQAPFTQVAATSLPLSVRMTSVVESWKETQGTYLVGRDFAPGSMNGGEKKKKSLGK